MRSQLITLLLFSVFLPFGHATAAERMGTTLQRDICIPLIATLMSNRKVFPPEGVGERLLRLCIFRLNNRRANFRTFETVEMQDLIEHLSIALELELGGTEI